MKAKHILSSALIALLFSTSSCRKGGQCEDGFFGLDRIKQTSDQKDPLAKNSFQDAMSCTVTTYEWEPEVENFLLLNPNDAIYPGAILGASTLSDGGYASIGGDRAPINISVDLQGISNASVEAPSGKLSDVRNAINELLNQEITGSQPARLESTRQRVHSKDQLKAAVGVKADGSWGSVAASFEYNNTEVNTMELVKFSQIYYTVNVDRPDNPSDFWTSCPDESVFKGDVPVYVSEVKYGRMALFMINSTLSATAVKAGLDASFGVYGTDINIETDYEKERLMENSDIYVKVMGGNSANGAITAVGELDEFFNYITEGAEYSSQNRGVPISYTLRFVDDNSIAKIITATEYTVRECEVLDENQHSEIPDPINDVVCAAKVLGDDKIGDDKKVFYTFDSELRISSDGKSILADISYEIQEHDDDTKGLGELNGVEVMTAPPGKIFIEIDDQSRDFSATGSIDGAVGSQIINFGDTPHASVSGTSGGNSIASIRILTNPTGSNNNLKESSNTCSAVYAHLSNVTFNNIITVLQEE